RDPFRLHPVPEFEFLVQQDGPRAVPGGGRAGPPGGREEARSRHREDAAAHLRGASSGRLGPFPAAADHRARRASLGRGPFEQASSPDHRGGLRQRRRRVPAPLPGLEDLARTGPPRRRVPDGLHAGYADLEAANRGRPRVLFWPAGLGGNRRLPPAAFERARKGPRGPADGRGRTGLLFLRSDDEPLGVGAGRRLPPTNRPGSVPIENPAASPHTLPRALRALRTIYGKPAAPRRTDPFGLILYENVAYLASDARRDEGFAA